MSTLFSAMIEQRLVSETLENGRRMLTYSKDEERMARGGRLGAEGAMLEGAANGVWR